jgi:1-deoxy-D-xylulose-5-phosphate reductoisomerase
MKKRISILGSTGSIGRSTFEIINKKKKLFEIYLLAANKNYNLICKQIKKYKPVIFIIRNKIIYDKVKKKFNKNKVQILNELDIKYLKKTDTTISAIPGIAGLKPTLLMTKFSKNILIANKETIICGWSLIKKQAKKYQCKIIPIDSEHFSIFKLLEHHKLEEIENIYITASGGPFLNYKKHQFKKIKPKDALKHPKWKMGKKISVDSSTLINKILEVIEAEKLFNIPNKKIKILIHPNSLVHAIIELKNGLTKFIYHETSMLIPIANAIFNDQLDIKNFYVPKNKKIIENLFFKKVSKITFPIIKIKNRVNEFPSTSIIINSSNEVLVDHFLQKKIDFLSISKIIMIILNDKNYRKYAIRNPININQINKIDNWARNITLKKIRLINE